MTPEQLRNSLLRMAISGKLTRQNELESANEVICSSLKARQSLEKAKLIKKENKILPISEEEIPFDIPKNWAWVRLIQISSIEAGGTPDRGTPEYWNGNIPWLKIGDISNKEVTTCSEYISELGLENSSAKIFKKGTILYTIFATIGRVGILDFDASTNQAIAGITFYGNLNKDYLYYVLLSLKEVLVGQSHGMAQMNINQAILKQTPIPIPPLEEQERIVFKIEELMPLVNHYEEAWNKLYKFNKKFPVDMEKSILQFAFEGKLEKQNSNDDNVEKLLDEIVKIKTKLINDKIIKKEKKLPDMVEKELLFEIPYNWRWVRMSDVLDIRDGTHDSPKYYQTGIPFVTSKNLVEGKIDFSDCKLISIEDAKKFNERSYIDDGDILFAMIGTIGNPVIVKKDREFCIKNMALIKNFARDYLETEFVYYYLLFIENYLKSIAQASVQSFVSLSILRKFVFPIPPLEEQKRIVNKLEELLPLCKKLSKNYD